MAPLTNFSFKYFYKIFTEDASLPLLYHGAKKSKMTKNSNQGGPALRRSRSLGVPDLLKFDHSVCSIPVLALSHSQKVNKKLFSYFNVNHSVYELRALKPVRTTYELFFMLRFR